MLHATSKGLCKQSWAPQRLATDQATDHAIIYYWKPQEGNSTEMAMRRRKDAKNRREKKRQEKRQRKRDESGADIQAWQ